MQAIRQNFYLFVALVIIITLGHAQEENWCNVICDDPILFFCAMPITNEGASKTFENECELSKYNCLHPQNREILRRKN